MDSAFVGGRGETPPSPLTAKIFGILLFLSVSSLILLNKEYLIKYNIIINSTLILAFFSWLIVTRRTLLVNNVIKIYIFFTIYSFLTVFWSADEDLTLHLLLREVGIIFSMIVVYNLLVRFKVYNYFYTALVFSAFINFALLINVISIPGIDPYGREGEIRFMGTTGNANALAIALTLNIFITILLLEKSKKVSFMTFLYFNLLISMYTILMTVSRKGFVAGSFFISIYLLAKIKSLYKTVVTALLLGATVVIVLQFSDTNRIEGTSEMLLNRFEGAADLGGIEMDASTEQRLAYIDLGWDMFLDRPFFGWGLNTFRMFNAGHYAHNNYIAILVGTGVVGLFIFYLMYFFLFKTIWKRSRGTTRMYFLFLFLFFMVMDITLVSYYFRLYFMVIAFSLAYLREESARD